MNASIKPDTTTNTPKPAKPEAPPRSVTIVCAESHDGRLPVVVTVVPVADLEVIGVFVDYRKGSTPNESGAIPVDAARVSTIKQGDAAVAALAAREVSADAKAPAAPASPAAAAASPAPAAATPAVAEIEPDEKTRPVKVMDDAPKAAATKQPIVSHQIAPGVKLTVGQAETFRADVALPEAPAEGEMWFARGRFATNGGQDLSSGWTRI